MVKWGGAVVTVLLLIVWIGSAWIVWVCLTPAGRMVSVKSGGIAYQAHPNLGLRGSRNYTNLIHAPFQFRLGGAWPGMSPNGVYHYRIPTWMFVLATLVPTVAAWRLDARARCQEGGCRECGYDRSGLGVEVVCPGVRRGGPA